MNIASRVGTALILFSTLAFAQQPNPSPIFQRPLNRGMQGSLKGVVDLHTHPMSHLGFGGRLFHGAPDVGSLMLQGQIKVGSGCNPRAQRASSPAQALGPCYATHGGHDLFNNTCGNHWRPLLMSQLESGPGTHGVAPLNWPRRNDILHQQMWVDWIRRAYEGGLRVMVALSVNNETLATIIDGNAPFDDKTTGDLQIDETVAFVSRHRDFMEIARSPADLQRIVGKDDKLAIILGVELDNIGNFHRVLRGPRPAAVRQLAIRSEIERLHKKGVRYIFPIHLVDNAFGGTAVDNYQFFIASRHQSGHWPSVRCSPGVGKGVGFDVGQLGLWGLAVGHGLIPKNDLRTYQSCPAKFGHVNTQGLTEDGTFAINVMMQHGMLIDIDHMSRAAADQTLTMAENHRNRTCPYPLMSGHNGLARADDGEKSRTQEQYKRLSGIHGMAGVGWDKAFDTHFLRSFQAVAREMNGRSLALGSDINGFIPAPIQMTRILYTQNFPRARMGPVTWDYNRDGVAHYGMLPDFMRALENAGGTSEVQVLFNGAQAFFETWSRASQCAG